ncbi:MAG: hypothetical protein GY851_28070, partial [bacterium]|nr:hypothetical protein [bacterium]
MKRTPSHRAGFALLCVLWALAILTVLTIGFGRRAMIDRRAAAISVDHAQARFLARGAVERGIAYIQNYAVVQAMSEQAGVETPAFNWRDTPNLYEDGEVFASSGGEEFEDDVCTFTIDDAESRVSVNAATEELLEEIPELGFRSVSQITRRRGGDDGEPAHPFVAIEEIRYLEGIDDDTWFGYGDGTPLYDILTVWGDGRINLNTASREVLECVPDLEDNAIEAIMMYRTGGDGE